MSHTSETFLAKLEARRAIKSFENVPASDINIRPILEAIRLAPTSFGMQPFTVYVVSSDATKAELSAPSLNQPQVKECSHLLVFAARSDASAVAERYISACQLDTYAPPYAGMIRQWIGSKSDADMAAWSKAQAYIALGFGLAAAAELDIGSCPMEGFDPASVAKILKFKPTESAVAYMAIGVPNKDESKANPYPKFRFSVAELFNFE